MRLIGFACGLLFLSVFSVSAQELSRNEALIQFFAGQGCAIGPSTIIAARADGFSVQDIEALKDAARADPDTIKTGGWLVLSAEVCEIELPRIISRLRLSDPEIAQRISAVDTYVEEGYLGCFFILDGILEHLALTRGWSEKNQVMNIYVCWGQRSYLVILPFMGKARLQHHWRLC